MPVFVTVSLILSWIMILVLAAVSLALARQIGVLHERIAPVGALSGAQGARVGEPAPLLDLDSLTKGRMTISGGVSETRRLLLFVGPNCPICKKIIPLARRVALAENIELQLATDADDSEVRDMIAREKLHDIPLFNSRQLGLTYAVDKLPHAVLISPTGTVIARGLVNNREHLESLIVADELGVSSVQDYLREKIPAR